MKKLFTLLLAMVLIAVAAVAYAKDVQPGDTFTMTISITSSDGSGVARVSINTNGAPVSFVSAESISSGGNSVSAPPSLSGRFSIMNANGVATGPVGKVTLRVNNSAAPGTYTISPSGSLAATGVSGCVTITIPAPECAHTWDDGTVTTEATCTKEGVKTFKCTKCGETDTKTIAAKGHTEGEPEVTKEATCEEKGTKEVKCTVCGETLKTEEIVALGHKDDGGKETKAATCTEKGEKTYTCTVCDKVVKTEEIAALGHKDDGGKETKAATCTEKGEKTYTCTLCDEVVKTEEIAALGHKDDGGKETKAATCTEKGEKVYTCTVCNEVVKTEEIAALGHKDDGGKETKAATCTEKGEKTYTCTLCDEVVKTEEIAALGHKDDGGKETKAATCTEKGEKVYTCTVCNEVVKTEEIAALGHKPGEWVIVKEATKEEDGLKEQYCTVCDELLNSQVIPHAQWYHMTVCSVGPRFRDEGDITDKWDMFTPVDLSNDGEQVFDLVAGNKHIIGKVTVSVADGQVTVSYKTINHVEMKSDFLTFFADLASVTTLDESQLTGYAFGEAVSIADQLGGDTKVLVYIHGNAVYRDDARGLEELPYKTKAYQQYIEELKAVMD